MRWAAAPGGGYWQARGSDALQQESADKLLQAVAQR